MGLVFADLGRGRGARKDATADVGEEHQERKENGTCPQRCLLLTEHNPPLN